MRIYSEGILNFQKKCLHLLKSIIKDECKLKFGITRLTYNATIYPININCYEDSRENKSSPLAYYDPNFYRILINYTLCSTLSLSDLKNVLRHEFAHCIQFLDHGSCVDPHGNEFREICRRFNWGKEVYLSTIDLPKIRENLQKDQKSKTRLKKILALTQSDNVHEAALAIEMASKQMLNNCLESSKDSGGVTYFVDNLITFKKKSQKLSAIYNILNKIGIGACFSYGQKTHCLEVFGSFESVNYAKQLFVYLDQSMDKLWKVEKNTLSNPGIRMRNSFFIGFAKGVNFKLDQTHKGLNSTQKKALIALKQSNQLATQMIYKNLSSSSSSMKFDQSGINSGFNKGKNFNISFEKHRYLS